MKPLSAGAPRRGGVGARAAAECRLTALGAAVLIAVAASPSAPAASAGPLTQAACPGPPAQVSVFVPGTVPLLDWRENLAFDGLGAMWVSNLGWNGREGRLEKYDPAGTLISTLPLKVPVGVARGPDGLIYVSGTWNGVEGVFRFDPSAENPVPEKFTDGLPGANGMTFDNDGNLYISDFQRTGITKIRPDGTPDIDWTERADVPSPNGLAVVDDVLYANVTLDLSAPIERVPLADPGAHAPMTYLSPPPMVPKGLDDLAAGPGRALYVAAYSSGELLRVDRETGEACVLASGLGEPTSVRFPRAFGSFHPTRDLFITEVSGNIRHVRLP